MPTYTTNKQIIKPNNGEYPNTWNVPVNTDWDIIDKAFGSAFEVDVTSSDATPNAEACQNQRIDVTGFPSPATRYVSFPATIGGMWVVNNKSNGTIRVTVVGSASYLVLTTTKKALIFSDGVNASFADDVRLVQGTGITVSGDTISLTSPVTTALGGTGQTTYTSGQLLIGNASGGLTKATLTAGTNVTITNGDGAITINSSSGGGGTGITSLTLAGGLTGLAFTPNTLTASGTMTLGGTLAVGSGGTGATSLTGYVFGNGAGVMTASSTIPSSAITPSLGNMSTQSASAVAITGGTITGVPASFASGSLTGTTLINSTGLITTTATITGGRIIASSGTVGSVGYVGYVGPAGSGGGSITAAELGVPLLGCVPLEISTRIGGDSGVPIVIGEPNSAAAKALKAIALTVAGKVSVNALT
jgi:hypothetical protein